MWVREYHSIDAGTLAEAKDKMIKAFNENSFDDTYDTTESLYGTETDMEPGDNNGESTAELFCSDTEERLTTNIK
jgi:hypothetical protein